ncbi:hypothetical protein AB0M46_19245 [Dactylosporangium sp. NPDC051485]|uniref:hypothetical protein n=1 Tax=Dactylosporangium sp. NPDC051485 TaxID=3154846 RepID=UPI00343E8FDD
MTIVVTSSGPGGVGASAAARASGTRRVISPASQSGSAAWRAAVIGPARELGPLRGRHE